jgi:aryl-alcohol dehydrogenase-like predicted oxidoreductase
MNKNDSKLALGCEQLGGVDWGRINIHQQRAAVRCAWECGIRIFDTADVYGLGNSEKELSRTLGGDRHEAFIITKGGVRWNEARTCNRRVETYKDSSSKYLTTAVEGSLRRLRLDRIPFYLIHWPDANIPIEETLDTLQSLQRSGKIGEYGLANFNRYDIDKIPKLNKSGIGIQQVSYSLANREKEEELKIGRENNFINTVYGPLSQGLLTGKYNMESKFGINDRRHRLKQFEREKWNKNSVLISELKKISENINCQISDISLSWLFKKKYIDIVVCGAKSPEQVIQNVNSEKIKLSNEIEIQLDRISVNYGGVEGNA